MSLSSTSFSSQKGILILISDLKYVGILSNATYEHPQPQHLLLPRPECRLDARSGDRAGKAL